MRTSVLTCATAVALLVAGQALGASTMDYTLWLGGDNDAAGWENGATPTYSLAAGGDLDGQTFAEDSTVDWAAVVEVSGVHDDPGGLGDGALTGGAANMVFDLELRAGSAGGSLVGIGHATLSSGVATDAGFWSSINDGDCEGVRCVIEGAASPELNAAFAISLDVDGDLTAEGRLFDDAANDGPLVDYIHYPSTYQYPATSTAAQGTLVGMGAGYSEFGASNTGGVALTTASASCAALGALPLFEGQISMIGLGTGTFALVLNAGDGNNVLPGDACSATPGGPFATAVNTVSGDDITFEMVAGGATPPVFQSAVSRKVHGAAGTFDRPVPTETEGRKCDALKPLQIVATYDKNVQVISATSTTGTVTSTTASGTEITVTVGSGLPAVTTGWSTSIQIVAADASDASATTTDSVCVQVLNGDSRAPWNMINIFDLLEVRNKLGTAVDSTNFRVDVDASGGFNIFDLLGVRNMLNKTAPACP